MHALLLRRVDLGRAAEEADPGLRTCLADDRQELQPIATADVEVEQDDVGLLTADELLGAGQRLRLEHAIVLELEVDAAEHAQRGIVLDDEHRRAGRGPHGRM